MKKLKTFLSLALILQLLALPAFASAESSYKPIAAAPAISYLALGDSLAAGINPEGQLGKGYSDFLAETLQDANLALSFNKGFSYPGYTTADILKDLQSNVTKPVVGSGHEDNEAELQQSVASATIITISAGANDVLPYVKVDSSTGIPDINLLQLTAAVQKVGVNYNEILKAIYELNPNAQVYVMGYYNPFPHLAAEVQPQIAQLLGGLNGAIQSGMKGTSAVYVPTNDLIAKDYDAYLPNSSNIHLSEAGYQVVADAFAQTLLASVPGLTPGQEDDSENTAPLFTDIDNHWAKSFIEQAVEAGIVKGYADGTFKPEKALSRAEAASLLVRVLGLTADQAAPFTDIQQYNENTQAEIAAAYQFGIVKGSNGLFKPGEQVTRAHLALMVKRAYELVTGAPYTSSETAPYSDIAGLDAETKTAISMLHQFSIVDGADGKFMPNAPTTRAQAAKIFVNYALLVK